jgi:hypothetical protein
LQTVTRGKHRCAGLIPETGTRRTTVIVPVNPGVHGDKRFIPYSIS